MFGSSDKDRQIKRQRGKHSGKHADRHHILFTSHVSLTTSLPWCHLKSANKRAKFETLQPFCLLFALVCERIFIKTYRIESKCVYRTRKDTICRCVRVSFSPEMLEAGSVKGLTVPRPFSQLHFAGTLTTKQPRKSR